MSSLDSRKQVLLKYTDTEFITTKTAFTIPFHSNLKSVLKQVAVVKSFGRNIEKQPSAVRLHRAERSVLDLFAILSAMCFQVATAEFDLTDHSYQTPKNEFINYKNR